MNPEEPEPSESEKSAPAPGARRGARIAAGTLLVAAGVAGALWLSRHSLAVWRAESALPRGKQPSVLLITLDSVRADRLGFSGSTGAETPRLDRLAREGVVFERAYAQAPLGVPSHATILTGLMPLHHGIRHDQGDALRPGTPTLAEMFRGAGYRTGAFVATSDLDRGTGLDRGFDRYDDNLGPAGKGTHPEEKTRAAATVFRALSWLTEPDPRPAFLWVHLADAVPPLALPEPLVERYRDRPYEGAISAQDEQLGRLVDGVRGARPLTLVGVLANHGEALGDHGEPRHGLFVYSVTTHIPLVLSMPGHLPEGRRVAAVVRAMDVLPTLADACGLPAPPRADGASLVPLIVGRKTEGPGPAPVENVSVTSKYGWSPLAALRSGPYLYVRAPRPELYDVELDPEEKNDATARLPVIVARLERELAAFIPDTPERQQLPDPKDGLPLFDRYDAALALDRAGQRARAVVAYRSILSEAPGFAIARARLAECLLRMGRHGEAALAFQEILDGGHDDETTYLNLALLHYRQKDPKKALDVLRRGREVFPDSALICHRAGRLLLGLGEPAEAEAWLRRAVELEPRLADAHLALGLALERQDRREDARAAYGRLSEVAPLSDEAREASEAITRLGG